MTITYPIDYVQDGARVRPSDPEVFALASDFAKRELVEVPDFRDYRRVWLQCSDGKPVGMLAVNIWESHVQDRKVYCADIPLIRFIEGSAPEQLIGRCNSFLADIGLRGTETTIYIARREPKDSRCPRWKKWLKSFDARPADRWVAKVK